MEFSGNWSAAGASLFGAAQVIAIAGLALPEITGIVQFSWKTGMNMSSHPNYENH